MATLKQILVACTLVGLLTISSFAQSPQDNGNSDQAQQQDGTGDQQPDGVGDPDSQQDGAVGNPSVDCDGTGPQPVGSGPGKGRGGQMSWRQAQEDRQNQQALAMGPISQAEAVHVLFMRQEEKLARDVYITLDELWLSDVFENIAISEQRHMDAIGRIITAQKLVDSAADNTVGIYGDVAFGELFVTLTKRGEVSYAEALKVGAYIEELDIIDLWEILEDIENEYVARVFENLLRGSRNHLRAFVKELEGEGDVYAPQLMSQEQYDGVISGPVERGTGNVDSNNQSSSNNNSQGIQSNQ
jgi:hypothetical protein